MAYYYYIGPYVKRGWGPETPEADLFYAAPDGAIGSLDLRTDPTQDGNALFVFKDAYDAKGYVALNAGKPLAEEPCGEAAAILRDLYGVVLDKDGTLLRGLWEMLTAHADGVSVVNPLMPTHKGVMELWLANECVHAQPWQGKADSAWTQVQRVLADTYTALRADTAAKDDDTTLSQKWLGAMELKYKVSYTDIAPVALQDVAPIKPSTTYTETFPGADSGTLGGDLTWTETAGDWNRTSNKALANQSSAVCSARAEHDLSSDDMYCKTVMAGMGSGGEAQIGAPLVRYSSSANTYYYGGPYQNDDKLYLRKVVSGTETLIGANPAVTIADGDLWESRADGSTISSYQNGNLVESVSDSSITGNTRFGIFAYFAAVQISFDNIEAADLVAGVVPNAPIFGGRAARRASSAGVPILGGRAVRRA